MEQSSNHINLILESLKNGDLSAFERIYKTYYKDLFRFILKYTPNRELAEDLVQDTFLHLWTNRKKITIKSSLKNYLFRIVYNKLMDKFNDDKRKKEKLEAYYKSAVEDLSNAIEDDEDYKTKLLKKLEDCISKLPKKRRIIFLLKKQKLLKNKEIANKLNISIKTIEAHLTRGYAMIKACMDV